MDIQKEREAFLAHMRSIGSAGFMFELDEDGNFDDMSMAYAWSAWQAKSKAVPEGFILVPKEPTYEMLEAGSEARSQTEGHIASIWEAMIEAQEPAND